MDKFKVEETKLKKPFNWSIIIAIIAALISGIAVFISFYSLKNSQDSLEWSQKTHNQLLPLQQSNVILPESEIKISQSKGLIKEMYTSYDIVEPTIRNVGKATANNIKFRIYAVYFNNELEFLTSGTSTIRFFSDKIIHELPPESSANFGQMSIPHSAAECSRNLVADREQIALIFHLEYLDSIDKETPQKNKVFLFQYNIGGSRVYSLIGDDYLKIYDRLKMKLENDGDNEYLLNFINNNPPR